MNIVKQSFGKTKDGQNINLYTLTNKNGLKAGIINYGAILTSLETPDRNGKFADIVMGFDNLEGYIKDESNQGATVGRYANRIANAAFTLEGEKYRLAANNGRHSLHGGIVGFNKVVWKAEPVEMADGPAVKLTYLSKDGEEGFPGDLSTTLIYQLTNNDELKITYECQTNKTTIVNLTHHSYFNLKGHSAGNILDHELTINADTYTPPDSTLIPSGEIKSVKGTTIDFTKPHSIGERINKVEGGYDHNYVLNKNDKNLSPAACVYHSQTGRKMQVYTTEPGMQFYSGNFLDGLKGKNGAIYKKHDGLCLEAQHYPDSPNKPQFPSVVLKPGQKYKQITIYKFSVE